MAAYSGNGSSKVASFAHPTASRSATQAAEDRSAIIVDLSESSLVGIAIRSGNERYVEAAESQNVEIHHRRHGRECHGDTEERRSAFRQTALLYGRDVVPPHRDLLP